MVFSARIPQPFPEYYCVLLCNQFTIAVERQYIGYIGGQAKTDIFYQSEPFHKAMIVGEFGGKIVEFILVFHIHGLCHQGAVAMNRECFSDMMDHGTGKQGIFQIEAVFPSCTTQDHILFLAQEEITYCR